MKKKLLLTTILLSSIHIANATCTPPTTLKCNCAYPIINAEGKLECGTSYCGDKKCMPDGTCCEPEKYCDSSQGRQCCADGQTCDTTTGCLEKNNIETLCEDAGGRIFTSNDDRLFCISSLSMTWEKANDWCLNNGMVMPTIYQACPTANVDEVGWGTCPEFSPGSYSDADVWTATSLSENSALGVTPGYGSITPYRLVSEIILELKAICY